MAAICKLLQNIGLFIIELLVDEKPIEGWMIAILKVWMYFLRARRERTVNFYDKQINIDVENYLLCYICLRKRPS